eukprot:CAMPEP_0194338616 /NCGR_PEP_ID=MMETSP0171-20130528/80210_1 /TAXON_ID=218684 /ORGANISM="Corethron pennatum, Strain L29A3" /LENGTH=50 /DNA_ID=CAMNT_0039102815 /DNA_START=109 /DNA_END=257 /DNA_ORIENTATION=+
MLRRAFCWKFGGVVPWRRAADEAGDIDGEDDIVGAGDIGVDAIEGADDTV